jgi:excisionase family DNA binding protein
MSDVIESKSGTVPAAARYLDAREAASYLRVSVSWIRKATRRGEVPSFRIGARVVYDRGDLDLYVEERKREAEWRARERR